MPFGNGACVTQTSPTWTDVTTTSVGIPLTRGLSGLSTGALYRWRARVLYAPFPRHCGRHHPTAQPGPRSLAAVERPGGGGGCAGQQQLCRACAADKRPDHLGSGCIGDLHRGANGPTHRGRQVTLASSDVSEGTVSPTQMIFTSANWSTPQIATVTGVDDAVDDGDIAYAIVTTVSSDDANYNNLAAADVSVTNLDNDGPGVIVSAISGDTTEAGGQATFTGCCNRSRPAR